MIKVSVNELLENTGNYLNNSWDLVKYKNKYYKIKKLVKNGIILTNENKERKVNRNEFIFMCKEESFKNALDKISSTEEILLINTNNINEIKFENRRHFLVIKFFMNDGIREILCGLDYNIRVENIIDDLYEYFNMYLENNKWFLF